MGHFHLAGDGPDKGRHLAGDCDDDLVDRLTAGEQAPVALTESDLGLLTEVLDGGGHFEQVVPFFDAHEGSLSRILTDRGTEYCGSPDTHEYELYVAVENIDHPRTKGKSPQTNGIVERFHKTLLTEFYRLTVRKKIYPTLADLQTDLDGWLTAYNETRVHQGRWCYGRTPLQTFLDTIPLAKEKLLAA